MESIGSKPVVLVRGAGDIASGVIVRLMKSGFLVIALETEMPSMVRRSVSFAEAVFSGSMELEGITSKVVSGIEEAVEMMNESMLPIVIDPQANSVKYLKENLKEQYLSFVDATISKRNVGTSMDMAKIVIGLGPGLVARVDCHSVIESMRGHYLGRVIYEGSAIPNTGVPGEVGGESLKRLLKAPVAGKVINVAEIGDEVKVGDLLQLIHGEDGSYYQIKSELNGVVRGMIVNGFMARKGLKVGDVDPRCEVSHCFSISDKAMSIGGGVVCAILELHGGVSSF